MISNAMTKKLNEQITAEFSTAHSYLAMSCVFDRMGFKILSQRFHKQHGEEIEHAVKILHYIQEVGGHVTLSAIAQPRDDYKTVEEVVQAALSSEEDITRRIHDLAALADQEKDFATRSVLNWFIDEQVEEVREMSDLLRLVQLAGNNMLQVEARLRHEMMTK